MAAPLGNVNTEVGRELLVALNFPLAVALKAAFNSPRFQQSSAFVRKYFFLLLCIFLASFELRDRLKPILAARKAKAEAQKAAAQKAAEEAKEVVKEAANEEPKATAEKQLAEKAAQVTPAVTQAPPPPMPTVWQVLQSPGGGFEYWELLGSAAACAASSLVMMRKTHLQAKIVGLSSQGVFSREVVKYFAQFYLMAMFHSAISELPSHFRRLLALRWRRNVTHRLHDLYFSRMVYYRIMNESQELLVADPDIRICNDTRECIELISSLAVEVTAAVVYTVLFSTFTVRGRNWRWTVASPLFFYVIVKTLVRCNTPQQGQAHGWLAAVGGRFKQRLTRIQMHAQRICMLQGETFEQDRMKTDAKEISTASGYLELQSMPSVFFHRFLFGGNGSPGCFEAFAWFVGASMASNDVIARAGQQGFSVPLDGAKPILWGGESIAQLFVGMHSFLNACSGWGACVGVFFKLQQFGHVVERLKNLYMKLHNLQHAASGASSAEVFSDLGELISFEGVDISTPTGHELLKDLNFKVKAGDHLLIAGHNGAGKSSIMRCLCNLWPVNSGKISRPGGAVQAEEDAGLHEQLYYLPQKPCNILGTLSDQLTYPAKIDGGLPEAELRRWLRYVDLEHLADRDSSGRHKVSRVQGQLDSEDIDWEVVLSLGEQQALSIARLLYHHPRFAILDECTSAVGKGLERRLFELAREIGTTCITIAHRPALKEHHTRLLQLTGNLAEDGKGWKLSDLDSDVTTRPRCKDLDEVHSRIAAHLEAARCRTSSTASGISAPPEQEDEEDRVATRMRTATATQVASATDLVKKKWPSFASRLWAVVRLGLPTRAEKRKALQRMAVMLICLRARVTTHWWFSQTLIGMVRASMVGDIDMVVAIWVSSMKNIAITVAIDCTFKYQLSRLCQDMFSCTMDSLLPRVMQGATLVRLMQPSEANGVPSVENPALRLSEVKGIFDTIAYTYEKWCPMATALFFLPMMVRGVAWSPLPMVLSFVLYRGSRMLVPDFAAMQAKNTMLESRFQVLHTRLRSIAEPVAFSGGGQAERRIIEPHFEEIQRFARTSIASETLHSMVRVFFTDDRQFNACTRRVMSNVFARKNIPSNSLGVAPDATAATFLYDKAAVQHPMHGVQNMVELVGVLDHLDGQLLRCLELVLALDTIGEAPVTPIVPGEGRIAVEGLDLATRQGPHLARGLAFEAKAGRPLLVTGPNASGKSLLGSVLLGLWPASGTNAKVSISGATGPRPPLSAVMPAPQQTFLFQGPLFAQLAYPAITTLKPAGTKLRVEGFSDNVRREHLLEHFQEGGGVSVEFRDSCALVDFRTEEEAKAAAAQPQELGGQVLLCDIEARHQPGAPQDLPNLLRMRQALRTTGIDYIFAREKEGWLAERTWEDTLSGGEQQRLCFARILYHSPTFGLMDECTSMVAADAEEDLYRRLFREWGITPITLTQRMFMPDLYQCELKLGCPSSSGWVFVQ